MRRLLVFVMSMVLCLALSAADGASIPGIYRIPCGSLAGNTSLTRIDVCGEASIDGYDTGTAEVERGTELTVRAKCAKGYVFKGWRQGVTIVSTQMVYSTTMTEDKNLVAMFAPKSGDSLYGEEYLMLTFDRSVSPVRVTVSDEDNLTEFAALEGNINKNPGQRTVWTFAQEGVVIEPGSEFCVEVQLKNIDTNPCYSALYAVVLQRAETDDDTSVEGMPELSYSPADGVYIVGESVVVFKGGLRYNLCGQRLWK